MKNRIIHNIALIGLFLITVNTYPNALDYHSKGITIEDGLLSNLVNNIYQDKDGLMWIGTENGLSKYDGTNFTHFQYRPHYNNCLSSNIVYDVIEGSDSCIYVGTSNGLNKIENQSGEVANIPLLKDGVEIEVVVNDLLLDVQNNLWIGTNKGLFIYDIDLKIFVDELIDFPLDEEIYILCADKNHKIWIGSKSRICSVSLGNSEAINEIIEHPSINKYSYINCIKDVSTGIWISTDNANYVMPYLGGEVHKISIVKKETNEELHDIKDVFADGNNTLWISSGAGLFYLDSYLKKISRTDRKENSIYTVQQYRDFCCIDNISGDRNNNIWLSYGKMGVILLYQSNINSFKIYNNLFGDNLTNYYTSISINNQNDLYAGTNGDGLYYFDNLNKSYSRLNFDNSLFRDIGIVVTSTCMDADNTLWFGTYNKSFYSYNSENGLVDYSDKIISRKHNNNLPLKAILEYGNKLLIGSNGNGLYVYDKISEEIKNYNVENSDLSSDYISCLYVDKHNRIWIGTYWGLNLIDLKTERSKKFLYDKNNSYSVSNNIINSINEDQNGNLWICTSYGLNKFNEDFTFKTIVENDGLPSNFVCSVVEGHNQEVWIATKRGLCALNLLDYSFKKYKLKDSKTIIEFDENVWNKGSDGSIYLGSNIGIIHFDPSRVKDFPQDREIKITDIKLLNKSLLVNENVDLLKSNGGESYLKVKHAQNVITFEYSAVNFIDPWNDEFQFKLEGFDNAWQKIGNKRTATYTNLSPGNYKFKVKLINQIDGEEAAVNVKILPPLWLKWYAYVFYIIILIILLWIFKRYSIIGLKLKHELLTKEMNRQKEKERNEMKYRFFTNISHEFRTPLTLIISPLEKLIDDNKNNPIYDVILKNAKRMQRLVNQLLEFRMIESEVLKLNLKNGDIIKAVHNICDVFNNLAEDKKIQYSFKSSIDSLVMAFDYDKIEKILYNLISNAFKNTEANGKVNVLIEPNSEGIQFVIEDSGVGIPKEELPHVFELFYSSPIHKTSKPMGSGVGLSLTKKLVDLHEGSIQVSSKPNVGTKLIIKLPKREAAEQVEKEEYNIDTSKNIENYISEDFGINESYITDLPLESSRSVLIIEDNDEIRMFLSNLLLSKYKVIEASNGKEGLLKAKKNSPDLVLADVMMPVMNGIEFCKRIKKDPKTDSIPVIIITAYHDKQFAIDALQSGAIDFIEKPFDPKLLLSKVENIISDQVKLNEKYKKKNLIQPSIDTGTSKDEDFLKKAVSIIEANLIDNKISVELLAKEIGVTQISLYRKIKKCSSMTPVEFIKVVKIKKAAEFLKNDPGLTINEVSYMVGFSDIQYFRKSFKKEFGVNPSEYKTKS